MIVLKNTNRTLLETLRVESNFYGPDTFDATLRQLRREWKQRAKLARRYWIAKNALDKFDSEHGANN